MKRKHLRAYIKVLKSLLLLNTLSSIVAFGLCLLVIFLGNLNQQRFDIFTVNPGSKFAYFSFFVLAAISGFFIYVFLRAFIILSKRKTEKLFIVKLACFFQMINSLGYVFIGVNFNNIPLIILFSVIGTLITVSGLIFVFRIKREDMEALFNADSEIKIKRTILR